ncbi:hypothetical protein [Mycobacterium tilburgii]|uniref:hypothetical protein n=1 Tax=Mycobacterium tilburgii TaxID=44467 RepID=UPI0021B371E3|nr:hypothetical protein [Mycobacterium tilburgii]
MPSAAAAALSGPISDEPSTRSGSFAPCSRAAHTSGIPSATTSESRAIRSVRAVSQLAARATSMFTGMIAPPRPSGPCLAHHIDDLALRQGVKPQLTHLDLGWPHDL